MNMSYAKIYEVCIFLLKFSNWKNFCSSFLAGLGKFELDLNLWWTFGLWLTVWLSSFCEKNGMTIRDILSFTLTLFLPWTPTFFSEKCTHTWAFTHTHPHAHTFTLSFSHFDTFLTFHFWVGLHLCYHVDVSLLRHFFDFSSKSVAPRRRRRLNRFQESKSREPFLQ